ncbi:MAG TPA: Host attachment protein [Rhodobacteraceae bacterium]|jgi:protein required for attachment to host cells|nr:Host attachment protein [Paracoccaceae bacterium]
MTDHPIKQGTWILIADSEKALFLRNDGDDMDFNLGLVRKDEQENPSTHEQGAHKPGRFNDGPNVQRSSVGDTDWHKLEKERFAHDLADRLYKLAHKGAFDSLVIAAAPSVLGSLRDELHSEVRAKVVAEVDKNLTNEPVDKIEVHLVKEFGTARDTSAEDARP